MRSRKNGSSNNGSLNSTPIKKGRDSFQRYLDTMTNEKSSNFEYNQNQEQNLRSLSPENEQNSKKNNSKYKTELCQNWQEKGQCCYGDQCRFAHGQQEMNIKLVSNKNYKTTPCHHFFTTGVCSYGIRCAFQHDIRSISEINNNYFQKQLILASNALFLNAEKPSSRLQFFHQLTHGDEDQEINGKNESQRNSSNVQSTNSQSDHPDHYVSNSDFSQDNDINQLQSSDKEEIMNSLFNNE